MKKPRPFQERAIVLGVDRNVFVWHDAGLGKTVTGIEIAKRVRLLGKAPALPNLVVCKKGAATQWASAIREQDPEVAVTVWRSKNDVEDIDRKQAQYIVLHYELLQRLVGYLKRVQWATILLDEAQRIKNRKSENKKSIRQLRAHRQVALTGTPMHRHAGQLWSILNWLYPQSFTSYWKFHAEYVNEEVNPYTGYRKILGSKNIDRLIRVIKPFTVRETKLTAAPDLPEKIQSPVLLEMPPTQGAMYRAIKRAKDIEVDIGTEENLLIKNSMDRIIKLQQVTGNPEILGRVDTENVKRAWLADYIDSHGEERFIIFTKFRKTAEQIAAQHQTGLIIGGAKPGANDAAIAAFKSGKVRHLTGTIDALHDSFDLPEGTVTIFVDLSWSTIQMTQAENRTHRLTIKEPKLVIYLLVIGTVDQLIYDALQHNWSEQQMIEAGIQGGYLK
jgi:SNF2 family DNA or RNA helicase